ncbi:MAG: M20/M25/M40 family metallo-hydrolase, partial [Candidatus Magasanikbacteria bacterium]|nr:M20/M25/M40 family metallo-hydrolase [Candidatus Magasanikbacteria bacterium]
LKELLFTNVLEMVGSSFQSRFATYSILADGSLLVRVKGTIPGPHVAILTHVDTHPNNPGRANPMYHQYKGGDIRLPVDGLVISAEDLAGLEGKTIITSDGSSLLGGDCKAGVVSAVQALINLVTKVPDSVSVDFWFTVDEEIGVDNISVMPEEIVREWDVVWTVDGDEVGTIDVETMAGGKLVVEFTGMDAHPGDDGQNLHPAHYAAARLVDKLSKYPSPWNTSGRESFYYVSAIEEGNPNLTRVLVYPRSFDPAEIAKMARMVHIHAFYAARRYRVNFSVADSGLIYTNTASAIRKHPELLQPAVKAHHLVMGEKPKLQSVRYGTDGSTIAMYFTNLPAFNMGMSSRRVHSRQEFVVLEELKILPEIILRMIIGYGNIPWIIEIHP